MFSTMTLDTPWLCSQSRARSRSSGIDCEPVT